MFDFLKSKPQQNDFSQLKLKTFISPMMGLIFNAPESWVDNSDHQFFQVIEPSTNTQFTASGYSNSGATITQWAVTRLEMVDKGMPFLKRIKPPYPMEGKNIKGIICEYQGVFPTSGRDSRYLVLCLSNENVLVSFTITAAKETFVKNEALYRWLLTTQLDLYDVQKAK